MSRPRLIRRPRHGRVSPWVIVGLAVGGSALFVVAIGAVVMAAFHSSDAYLIAVHRAVTDSEVVARLGAPVVPGYFTMGSIETSKDRGVADIEIRLQGSTGTGVLIVGADKAKGQWTYRRLELRTDAPQSSFDLLRTGSVESKPPS